MSKTRKAFLGPAGLALTASSVMGSAPSAGAASIWPRTYVADTV